MEGESQTEIIRKTYARATLNPSKDEFIREINSARGLSFLDIGCGENPRMSVGLKKGDLWVGCDPHIKEENITGSCVHVHTSSANNPDSKLIVFNSDAASVPGFAPDWITCIAPNPKDVADDKIINYDLEKFFDSNKKQHFLVVMDNRTKEAELFKKDAIKHIKKFLHDLNFNLISSDEIDDLGDYLRTNINFKPNSADLGVSGNQYLLFVKPKGR